jgi:polar amino acid transport system substrate-binding protein
MSGDRTSPALKELVPTGKLRVAIGASPAPSAFHAIKDPTTGKYRGVTVDLATALAQQLGVPVEFIPDLAAGEIQAAANSGAWDVSFMPVNEERKKFMDFGSSYHLLQSTYFVSGAPRSSRLQMQTPPGSATGRSATIFKAEARRTRSKEFLIKFSDLCELCASV